MSAVDSTLALVETDGLNLVTVEEVAGWSEQQLRDSKCVVVVEGATEVATARAMPATTAKAVYSTNGELVGKWSSDSLTFRQLQLKNGRLHLVSLITLTERSQTSMAQNSKIGSDLQGLMNEVKKQAADANEKKETVAFDGNEEGGEGGEGGTPEMTAEEIEKQKRKEVAEEKKRAQKARLDEIQRMNEGVQLANTLALTDFNYKTGRLLFNITTNDDVVRISKKKVAKLNDKGQCIPNSNYESAPAAVVKKFNDTGVISYTKYCETEYHLAPVHCKPSTVKGLCIRMRTAGYFNLASLASAETINFNKDNEDMITFCVDKEAGILLIQGLFDGKIQEDSTLIPNATTIRAVSSLYTPKKKDKDATDTGNTVQEQLLRTRLVVVKTTGRTSLLTMDNFFPLRVFKTVSQGEIVSDEIEEKLNLGISKVMKDVSYVSLDSNSKDVITENNGVYSAGWFKQKNATAVTVKRFDSKDTLLNNVTFPLLKLDQAKSGTGSKISYEFYELDDLEHGPLAQDRFKRLFEATGMSQKEFIGHLSKIKNRTNKSGDSSNIVSNRTALASAYGAQLGTNTAYTGMKIQDVEDYIGFANKEA